jgi:beta-galactosidase
MYQAKCIGIVFMLAMGLTFSNNAEEGRRTTFNFNPGWRVQVGDPDNAQAEDFDDSAWKPVTLPYAWNEDEAFKLDIHSLSTGVAWYRKHFQLPKSDEGSKVFLEFEGVRQAGEFYINGVHIGRHENGVMAVGFDITNLVRFGRENVVAVRTDNDWDYGEKATGQKYQWADRNFNANYGGIPKNVLLHVTGNVYQTLPLYSTLGTTGVYVYARDFDIQGRSATITAQSQVRNESAEAKEVTYHVRIQDMEDKIMAEFQGIPALVAPGGMVELKASANVEGIHFWSWGYGYLYTVYTTLEVDGRPVDTVKTRTGFRKVELGQGMVKLNDRVIQFHGYAQRTSNEWPAVGLSVPPWLSDFSNRLIVEGNGNIIRWMHITPSKQDVESCDRVGLIQMMPAGDAESDVNDRRWGQRVELMRDAIVYMRNHPSIFFYEGGNEAISEAHQQELKDLRDRYDPYGGRFVGAREMLDSEVAEYGGEMLYINKSADQPLWATEYSRDEGLRKYWDDYSPPFHKDGDGPLYRNLPAREYNRNQDSHAIEDVIRWYDYWRERPGTGTRVSSGGCNIIFSDTNTHFRGAENYRRSGEVDPMRIPKDNYWANKVMWDCWVDIEKPATHILGHWNYTPEVTKDIFVVSSAEKVELFVNGQSKGFGEQSYRFLYTFKGIQWEPGVIKAVGYDGAGNPVCEAQLMTAGEPVALKLTRLGPERFKADGADLALVQVEVVDNEGRRCPVAMNPIEFELNGPAEWHGGIAQGPDNHILSRTLPVECGVNRVLIRSTTQAGQITLTARSPDLTSASMQITSESMEQSHGLSRYFPEDDLPSYLERGPTPSGSSYKVSRRALNIVDVTAGSNSEQARLSFDDNELSRWSNDGNLDTAWIQYTLEIPAAISEVTMKLHNWRRTSYDLQLFVDGRSVWSGRTEPNLGYTTIAFPPTMGRTLIIALQGISGDEDAFNIVEITGSRDQAGRQSNRGELSIVEIEIYETL